MKLINLACAMLVVAGMTSCAAESDESLNQNEVNFSLEKTFNARSLNYQEGNKNALDLSELTPISSDEAEEILNTLREQKNASYSYELKSKVGEPGQNVLTVSGKYSVGTQHAFTLELTMINYDDDNSLYYKDNKAYASSSDYKWVLSGFGLSSSGNEGMYKFECNSYLYFKIADEDLKFIQVPVKVYGDYNSVNHEMKFTYSL